MAGFTVTQLEAVEAALATGQLRVDYEGKRVEYRSVAELRAARDLILAELTAAGLISNNTPRTVYTSFSKG